MALLGRLRGTALVGRERTRAQASDLPESNKSRYHEVTEVTDVTEDMATCKDLGFSP